jgi:hypothetical protein
MIVSGTRSGGERPGSADWCGSGIRGDRPGCDFMITTPRVSPSARVRRFHEAFGQLFLDSAYRPCFDTRSGTRKNKPMHSPRRRENSFRSPPPVPWWKFWAGPPETVLTRATLLLAGATLILAIIAGIQAWILATTDASTREAARAAVKSASTAEDALKNARENFRSEQRPIIWLTNDLGAPVFVPNPKKTDNTGQIVWDWRFTNYGKTPALHLSFRHFMRIENKIEESYGAAGPSIGAPLPTNKTDFATVISRPGISADEFDRLLSSINDDIGISGSIIYFDAYGEKYETTFCLTRLVTGAILYCKEGNDIK